MYQTGKTKRRLREKEDTSGLGCMIVDDLLSKERVKLFFLNLEGEQLVVGQRDNFFHLYHWHPGDAISRLA